jgi:K+-sensing histidine kinase KdpD
MRVNEKLILLAPNPPEIPGLRLTDVDLPAQEIHRLYSLLPTIFGFATHDLRAPVNSLAFNIEITCAAIENALAALEKGDAGDLKPVYQRLVRCRTALFLDMDRFNRQMTLLFRRFREDDNIAAKLTEVVDFVSEVHSDVHISVAKRSPRTLEILFPRNVLCGIIAELVLNAARVTGQSPKVFIHWKVEGFVFTIEVHDNGPGVKLGQNGRPISTPKEPARYPELLSPQALGRSGSGLFLIANLLARIGGRISFKKSSRLGGTVVGIQFPINAYYVRGKGRAIVGG